MGYVEVEKVAMWYCPECGQRTFDSVDIKQYQTVTCVSCKKEFSVGTISGDR